MELVNTPKRFGNHDNAFGFLRLLFASLVIFSHTAEIIDGNRSRDGLTFIYGTLSFGDFAVNCFFIVSGYLISASYLNSSSISSYMKRRVARIYPGFIVVFVLCAFVVAPIGGADIPSNLSVLGRLLHDCLFLQKPTVSGAFDGQPYPSLNGSLWTIAYEFRCYLLVVVLGITGILKRSSCLLTVTLLCLAASLAFPIPTHEAWQATDPVPPATMAGYSLQDFRNALIGNLRQDFRLAAVFLAGACFYAYRHAIVFSAKRILVAAIGLILSLCFNVSAVAGMMLFGSYLILAFAQLGAGGFLARINNKNDISYGVYLYAWPITKVLNWWFPGTSLVIMIAATWVISCVCGWLSWMLIEKPVMQLIRTKRSETQTAPNAVSSPN